MKIRYEDSWMAEYNAHEYRAYASDPDDGAKQYRASVQVSAELLADTKIAKKMLFNYVQECLERSLDNAMDGRLFAEQAWEEAVVDFTGT